MIDPTNCTNPESRPTALLDDQRQQWRRGCRTPVEAYLRHDPVLASDAELILDLIYGEALLREECGEEVTLDEYLERFPEYADELRPLFDVHQALKPAATVEHNAAKEVELPAITPRTWIGGHEIISELGRGGMGIVYKARQPGTGRLVALKVILAGRFASDQEIARFQVEAAAAAQLDHPGIVPVYQAGQDGETYYFCMGYVPGKSLAQRLADGALPPIRAAELIRDAALAVQYAHERGVIHRDLKPQNILLTDEAVQDPSDAPHQQVNTNWPDDASTPKAFATIHRTRRDTPGRWQVRITDFGVAHLERQGTGLTSTGRLLGTPQYMSPEQAQAQHERIGPRSDVYSLGAVLYESLTGRPPFDAAAAYDILDGVIHLDPPPPRLLNPKFDRDLETICMKCLEKDPLQRYDSAAELATDLSRYLSGEPIQARRIGIFGQLWRWARRRPGPASLAAAGTLLVAGFFVSLLAFAMILHSQNRVIQANLTRARRAEKTTTEQLYASLVAEARAIRLSGQAGQRTDGLKSLRRAAEVARQLGLSNEESLRLRQEAIATMMLPDIEPERIPRAEFPDGHDGEFFDAAGERLVCVDQSSLVIRDVATGRELRRLFTPDFDQCERVIFLPRLRRLAALLWDRKDGRWASSIRIWDLETPQTEPLAAAVESCKTIELSADGQILLVLSAEGDILHCDPVTGQSQRKLSIGFPADGLRCHPAGRRIAVWRNSTIRLIDGVSGDVLARFAGPSEAGVQSVRFSKDGTLMAVGSIDHKAYIWTLAEPEVPLHVLEGHQGWVKHVAFHPSGRYLATGCRLDRTSLLWDTDVGKPIVRFDGQAAAFSQDGAHLVGSSGPLAQRWRLHDAGEYRPLRDPAAEVTCDEGEFSPDDRWLATFGWDRIQLWDVAKNCLATEICGEQMATGRFAPGGEFYLATCASPPSRLKKLLRFQVRRHDSELEMIRGPSIPITADVPSDGGPLDCLRFTADGKRVAAAGSGIAFVQSVDDPTGSSMVVRHAAADGAAITSDGQWLATAARRGFGVKIWSGLTGAPLAELVPDAKGTVVDFSPDDRWLVACTMDELVIWRAGCWAESPTRLPLGERTVDWPRLVFSSDGRYVAVSHRHYQIVLADPGSGRVLTVLPATHHNPWLSFSHDSRQLACGDGDQSVSIWDLPLVQQQLTRLGLHWQP